MSPVPNRELDRYGTSTRFRDIMRKFIAAEVERLRPRYRYATVRSVDEAAGKALVRFPGESVDALVSLSGSLPAAGGDTVRIEGLRGDRYIAAITSGTSGLQLLRHYDEILKEEGVAPDTEYTTTYKPRPYWPKVVAGGQIQTPLIDYYMSDDTTLVIEPAMNLREEEMLWIFYDYIPNFEAVPPTYQSSYYALSYDYQYNFVLGDDISPGDIMIAAWANWHGWGINEAAGWIPLYNLNNSGNNVVCAKLVDTEQSGDTVTPSVSGQGYRSAGQMVVVRGVDPNDPIHQITTGGGAISAGAAKKYVVHLVENVGAADPTLSRGDELQHAYDGNMGIRASQEVILAGQTVSCSTNAGFLASVALNAES